MHELSTGKTSTLVNGNSTRQLWTSRPAVARNSSPSRNTSALGKLESFFTRTTRKNRFGRGVLRQARPDDGPGIHRRQTGTGQSAHTHTCFQITRATIRNPHAHGRVINDHHEVVVRMIDFSLLHRCARRGSPEVWKDLCLQLR